MGFFGSHFSFNGIPCEEFGLAIYDISGNSQGDSGMVASVGEVIEDWIPSRSKSFFYGIKQNTPLSFKMVFGVNPELNQQNEFPTMDDYLDRWEISEINNWLTGHSDSRKWLEIEQPDMETVRFLCAITDLEIITHAWYPWAFSCTVTCDSPYGYMFPKVFSYNCVGETTVTLRNKSSVNEFYYPRMTITPRGVSKISIVNQSDKNREFLLNNLPITSGTIIEVDNERGIIKTSDGRNIYDYFNFQFFRLKPGNNKLVLSGDFNVEIHCEFPMNVGG